MKITTKLISQLTVFSGIFLFSGTLAYGATVMKNCEADVSITSDASTPSCFTATSSKNLSNVVLKDANGVEYKFDGLNGHTGTFCHPSGLAITDVWVKSGCYKSGDGPGYGYHFEINNGGGGGGIDGMQTTIGQAQDNELKNCEATVSITSDASTPSCFTATSSKNLSNVVLKDANGVEYKFDGLNGHTGTFCHPSGLAITDVWVKSGCYKSGDGPGYGYHFEINNGGGGGGIDGMQTTIGQAQDNELKNCEATVSITSDASTPSCFTATSSKNLSNVVLKDANGVEYKFDGLNGHTGTFCHPSGLAITDVWVKSGCYKSGDGPGYGYHFEINNGGGGGGIDGMQTTIGQTGKGTGFAQEASLHQYPNPAETNTTFEFSVPVSEVVNLSIVGMNGQTVENLATRDVIADQAYSVTYNVSNLENGIYFVHLTSKEGTVKKKFVVLK